MAEEQALVLSVTASALHDFSKPSAPSLTLIQGYGIEGDSHAGETVQHRSRLHLNPSPPNLRQVHLIPIEILQTVSGRFSANERRAILDPGALGQNITTEGIDLLALGSGTELHFVDPTDPLPVETAPAIKITGLRNPCPQIDDFLPGLREEFLIRDANRRIVGRLAGVMATVTRGGVVTPWMKILVSKPAEHVPLGPV
ncbi:pyruvate kinase-like protein [Aspergillus crustosus]